MQVRQVFAGSMGNNHGGKGTRKTCISCRRSGRGVQYHRSNRCPYLAENFGGEDEDDDPLESDTGQGDEEAEKEATEKAKKEATEGAEKEATETSAAAREAKRVADEAEAAAVHADAKVSLPCPNACLRFPPPRMHSTPLHHACIRFFPMSAFAFLPNAYIRLPSSCMHACYECIPPSSPTHACMLMLR